MHQPLQEAIHQRKFRNIHQEVQINIIYTSSWIVDIHQKIFKKYGLSSQQYNVLRILRGALPEALSLGLIKSRMLDRMSDTSRIVERLRKSGLIKRTTNSSDRRVAKITISEKGLALLSEMESEEKNMDKVSHALTDEEIAMLNQLLNKMRSVTL
ncbi:MAG: MarR family transcriptional regulator [Bacteroidia bacterium]